MGIPALRPGVALSLLEGLAEAGLEELRRVAQLDVPMRVRALRAHLALADRVLLADLGLLKIRGVLQLGLAVCERALFALRAVPLEDKNSGASDRKIYREEIWANLRLVEALHV